MKTCVVMTVMAADGPGLVRQLSETVARHDGSWLESRMARLAGQFAGILRIDCPEANIEALMDSLRGMEGMTVQVQREDNPDAVPEREFLGFEIVGNDRPGIVRSIAAVLAKAGANVEDLHTTMESAPMAGHPLFRVCGRVSLPGELDVGSLIGAIENLGEDLAVTFDR